MILSEPVGLMMAYRLGMISKDIADENGTGKVRAAPTKELALASANSIAHV